MMRRMRKLVSTLLIPVVLIRTLCRFLTRLTAKLPAGRVQSQVVRPLRDIGVTVHGGYYSHKKGYTKVAGIALVIVSLVGGLGFYEDYTVHSEPWEFEHPGGLHSQAQISVTKQKIQQNIQPWKDAYNELTAKASEYLDYSSHAVEDYYAPGYYDDPDGSMAAKELLYGDAFGAYCLALAYAEFAVC